MKCRIFFNQSFFWFTFILKSSFLLIVLFGLNLAAGICRTWFYFFRLKLLQPWGNNKIFFLQRIVSLLLSTIAKQNILQYRNIAELTSTKGKILWNNILSPSKNGCQKQKKCYGSCQIYINSVERGFQCDWHFFWEYFFSTSHLSKCKILLACIKG